jgi:hypothetical protein
MNFFLFNLFSTIEVIAVIILMLSIFKYRVMDYIPQILLTSLTMSLISHTIHFEFENNSVVPIVSIIVLFIFVWLAFRVALLYAMIISVVGYVTYGLLQTVIVYILQFTGLVSLDTALKPYSLLGYLMQLITSIVACLISYQIRKKNFGFNWIPYSSSAKFRLKGDNIILFITVIVSVFVIGLAFFLFLTGYVHLIANFILIFIVLALLFYLASKQEGKYYD